jgi:hypothetical protein
MRCYSHLSRHGDLDEAYTLAWRSGVSGKRGDRVCWFKREPKGSSSWQCQACHYRKRERKQPQGPLHSLFEPTLRHRRLPERK